MRLVLVLSIACVLAGCAPSFSKAGVSPAEQAADEFDCARAARFWGAYGENVSFPQMKRCMGARGYSY